MIFLAGVALIYMHYPIIGGVVLTIGILSLMETALH